VKYVLWTFHKLEKIRKIVTFDCPSYDSQVKQCLFFVFQTPAQMFPAAVTLHIGTQSVITLGSTGVLILLLEQLSVLKVVTLTLHPHHLAQVG